MQNNKVANKGVGKGYQAYANKWKVEEPCKLKQTKRDLLLRSNFPDLEKLMLVNQYSAFNRYKLKLGTLTDVILHQR